MAAHSMAPWDDPADGAPKHGAGGRRWLAGLVLASVAALAVFGIRYARARLAPAPRAAAPAVVAAA
ncbi:MAG TPA: hypothetical protein VIC32_02960, partial [Terriglobales bacterium]